MKKSVYSILIVLTLTMLLIFGGLLTSGVLANDDDKIIGIYDNDPDLPSYVLELEFYKFDPPESGTAEGVTIDVYDGGLYIDWESTRPIAYVFVKGGPLGGNLYDYTPGAFSGTGLHVPENDGQLYQVSHITFYFANIVPGLEILKTGDVLSKVGDSVDYTFTIRNTGNIDLELVSVIDDVIGDLSSEFPAVLYVGDEVLVEVSHEVPEGSVDFLTNTVEAIYSVYGDASWTVSSMASHSVELFTAGVSITKEADMTLVQAGDVVNYTITVTNESSANAPLLEVELTDDMLVLNESFSLVYGETATFEESYTIQDSDAAPLINTAYVLASPAGFPNEYREEASWELDIFEPSIMIEKTGDDLSKAGDDVTYTITVTNTSSDNSPNLVGSLEDPMLGLDIPLDMAPGDVETITEVYTIPMDAENEVVNTATVTVSPADYSSSNQLSAAVVISDQITASASHTVELFTAGVSLDKVADRELVKVGDVVNYTITVTNDSSSNAPLLEGEVNDTMLGLVGSFSLGYGETAIFTESYTIQASDVAPLINTASVLASPAGFPNEYTAEDSWELDIFVPSIEIMKTGDPLSKAGDDVTFEITVTNTSSDNSPNLVGSLTDPMLGLDMPLDLTPGEVYVETVVYTIPLDAVNEVLNTATVRVKPVGYSALIDEVSASASHRVELFTAAVSIDKTADKSLAKVGDTVNYTITVTNESSANAPDLAGTVTDTMLNLEESITLGFEEVAVFNASYIIKQGDTGSLTNTASVVASPVGFPNRFDPSASWTVEIFEPSIEIEKTGDALSKAGDDVTYTITVRNTSSSNSPNLVGSLTDPMLGLDIPLDMASGDVETFTEVYTIPMDAENEVVNTATVTVAPAGYTAVSDEITASASHLVDLFTAGVLITKTGDKTQVFVGETVNYTITVTNDSSVNAPDLEATMTDAMLGLTESFTLGYGESREFYPSYIIQSGDPDPFVNTAEVTASPVDFPNIYTAQASWSVDLIYGETAWAAHDVGVYRYNDRGNWATYIVYAELENGIADIYAGQNIYVGYVEFADIGGGEVEITVDLDGWNFVPGSFNLYVQDYDSAPSGNPAPGSFEYKEVESGSGGSIIAPLNDFYGIHLNVYELE